MKLYGNRILTVEYENLVENPAETGGRIYEFCGLNGHPEAVRYGHPFTTDEFGQWKHYEPYLGTLRQALGRLARQSSDHHYGKK